MSKSNRDAKRNGASKAGKVADVVAPAPAVETTGKRIFVLSPASLNGENVATVGKMIAGAIAGIVGGLRSAESGVRAMLDGSLTVASNSAKGGYEPEMILQRIAKLFTVAREATIEGLSPEARGEFDGYLPSLNPQPSKEGRKAQGLPMKDRLNARDVRILARRAGTMSAEVRQAHDAIEATYNFGKRVASVVQAALTVEGFTALIEQYDTALPNGIDYALSATALIDAAKDALREASPETVEAEVVTEGDGTPDTVDAIIARTVAQLRAIDAGTVADAILATVAALATPAEVVAE